MKEFSLPVSEARKLVKDGLCLDSNRNSLGTEPINAHSLVVVLSCLERYIAGCRAVTAVYRQFFLYLISDCNEPIVLLIILDLSMACPKRLTIISISCWCQ